MMDITDPDFAAEYIVNPKMEMMCAHMEELEGKIKILESKFEVMMVHMAAPAPAPTVILNTPQPPAPIVPPMVSVANHDRKPMYAVVMRDKNGKIESMKISETQNLINI